MTDLVKEKPPELYLRPCTCECVPCHLDTAGTESSMGNAGAKTVRYRHRSRSALWLEITLCNSSISSSSPSLSDAVARRCSSIIFGKMGDRLANVIYPSVMVGSSSLSFSPSLYNRVIVDMLFTDGRLSLAFCYEVEKSHGSKKISTRGNMKVGSHLFCVES